MNIWFLSSGRKQNLVFILRRIQVVSLLDGHETEGVVESPELFRASVFLNLKWRQLYSPLRGPREHMTCGVALQA